MVTKPRAGHNTIDGERHGPTSVHMFYNKKLLFLKNKYKKNYCKNCRAISNSLWKEPNIDEYTRAHTHTHLIGVFDIDSPVSYMLQNKGVENSKNFLTNKKQH